MRKLRINVIKSKVMRFSMGESKRERKLDSDFVWSEPGGSGVFYIPGSEYGYG